MRLTGKFLLCVLVVCALSCSALAADYKQYKVTPDRMGYSNEFELNLNNNMGNATSVTACTSNYNTNFVYPCTHNNTVLVKCSSNIKGYTAETATFVNSINTGFDNAYVDSLICGDDAFYSGYTSEYHFAKFNYTTFDVITDSNVNMSNMLLEDNGNIIITTKDNEVREYDSDMNLLQTADKKATNCIVASGSGRQRILVQSTDGLYLYYICDDNTAQNVYVYEYDSSYKELTYRQFNGGGCCCIVS